MARDNNHRSVEMDSLRVKLAFGKNGGGSCDRNGYEEQAYDAYLRIIGPIPENCFKHLPAVRINKNKNKTCRRDHPFTRLKTGQGNGKV